MPHMEFGFDHKNGHVKVGKWGFNTPQSRKGRLVIGSLLVVGGIFGFLPVLGFWMVPLGLLILSQELPSVRRRRRRLAVWWEHRRRQRALRKSGADHHQDASITPED